MSSAIRYRQRGNIILGLVESTGSGATAQACIVIYIATHGVAQYDAVAGVKCGYLQAKIFIFIGGTVTHAHIKGKRIGCRGESGILYKGKQATSMPLTAHRLVGMQAVAAAR